jgi:hypothetical protein
MTSVPWCRMIVLLTERVRTSSFSVAFGNTAAYWLLGPCRPGRRSSRGLDKHGQKKWRRHVAMTMPAGYRPPVTKAIRGPVRISVGRELLSAPPSARRV